MCALTGLRKGEVGMSMCVEGRALGCSGKVEEQVMSGNICAVLTRHQKRWIYVSFAMAILQVHKRMPICNMHGALIILVADRS